MRRLIAMLVDGAGPSRRFESRSRYKTVRKNVVKLHGVGPSPLAGWYNGIIAIDVSVSKQALDGDAGSTPAPVPKVPQ